MKICYFVTVSNEYEELKKLLTLLSKEVDFYKDDLVILVDSSTVTLEVKDLVDEFVLMYDWQDPTHNISVGMKSLNGDFATHKNWILGKSKAEYCIQLDADELPSIELVKYLSLVLEANPEVDVWIIQRHNYVIGITEEYIKKWGWRQDSLGRINPFDEQTRIFRNDGSIKWFGTVHERLQGGKRVEVLPAKMYLDHTKTLAKQILQNQKYESMI